ncbi:MAG: hypothetical protein HY078_07535 [Elusimicrobia bacterium]|nr:hypothetical protein [Elusimicrobiota bacterium]
MPKPQQEVGDLFVTEEQILIKLLPSNKSASKRIEWFSEGVVTDHNSAAKDIASLVGKLTGKTRLVRGLTLMTDLGADFDTAKSGLHKAVEKAGYDILN